MPELPQGSSLSPAAARKLATTTKTAPQMRGISPRWLMRMLPWVAVEAGMYRVNRRLRYDYDTNLVSVAESGGTYSIDAPTLGELGLLRNFAETEVFAQLADAFVQEQLAPGEPITAANAPMQALTILAHGRALEFDEGDFGELIVRRTAGEGNAFGAALLDHQDHLFETRVEALTPCVVLRLAKDALWAILDASPALEAHIAAQIALAALPQDKDHQPEIAMLTGGAPESPVPQSYVAYETSPEEIELSVVQSILRVNTRVADLYNQPYNQLEQQLRLTIEALRERQEYEIINNPGFGLLHDLDPKHRLFARPGPPTPEEVDDLVCRCRQAHMLLAHPRTIAAFGRECTRQGISTRHIEVEGQRVQSWRGVPLLPCDKIPISSGQTSTILCLRVGEELEGVIGLHQPGLPDELEPSLNARFMGTSTDAVSNYLVSAYYSVAVLIPSAVNALVGVGV